MRKATIKDVALLAGVSASTVSRVFSGGASISAETCCKVQEAAKKLNYTPNTVAQGLRCDKSRSIGVVFPDIAGEFYASCASAILRCGRAAGYTVLFTESGNDIASERGAVNALVGRCVDGMLFIGDNGDAGLIQELSERTIPIVTGDRVIAGIPSVTFNNRETVSEIVAALYASGKRRFVYVGETAEGRDNLLERYRGFTDALALYSDTEVISIFDDRLHGDKRGGACEIFDEKVYRFRPDAIVTSNDLIVQGILRAANSHGVKIPEDMAVTGFDDMGASKYFIPSISTVRQNTGELARRCFEMLLDLIDGKSVQSSVIRQEIIWRDSARMEGQNMEQG